MFVYNIALYILQWLFPLVWRGWLFRSDTKLRRFVMGQRGVLRTIEEALRDEERPRLWFHASSYGEYNVARPLLRQIQQRQDLCVVLTFFSSTGYEILRGKRREQTGADHVFYLPLDTSRNARRFLNTVRPVRAVFMISEFWMNYLRQLRRRGIPTFVVSALILDDSYLLRRWYGRTMRRALRAVTAFLVLNERSRQNLASIGFDNAIVVGDPLFDNALLTAQQPFRDEVIERFCAEAPGGDVFIAGSLHTDDDLVLVARLVERHPDVRFIVVPHEVDKETLVHLHAALGASRCQLHTHCTAQTTFDHTQVLIIDFVGALARLYRYGRWAYVGGGFTPLLHSVIEASVYGLPVAFGPKIRRQVTAQRLMEQGVGQSVATADELDAWFTAVRNPALLAEQRQRALDFARRNGGSTQEIVDIIRNTK